MIRSWRATAVLKVLRKFKRKEKEVSEDKPLNFNTE